MRKPTLSGTQFLRLLANLGIPASAFAHKAGCQLRQVYELKRKAKVPQRYLDILARFPQANYPKIAMATG